MHIRNDRENYGAIAIGLHWLVALTVFGQFGMGLWMRSLGYYDAWYQLGPWWHKGIGVMLLLAMLIRLVWRLINPRPAHLETHKPYERLAASLTHGTLYLLLFLITLSGYLISTADGRALEVFDWFSIPATISGIDKQEDIAGDIHLYLAWGVIVLAGIHAMAAIKHHFIDRDRTLKRMLGRS
ncbi:MAG: cytochrome b [Candidatus Thiodiazotropha sp. (ex Monitilora ramsayi)]|nr:cytochrome b [Candidatus Thiodiazotropha sp. (ex Monitilora ramsayi)]